MNYSEASNYFYQKVDDLVERFNLNKMGINPCSLNSYESIRQFTEKLLDTLFFEEDYQILDSKENNQNVEFIFNNEKLTFDFDSKRRHIEVDFFQKIKFLGILAGKMVTSTNPVGLLISGGITDMERAWNAGLPIHVDSVNFLHYNYNGNRFKKSELGNKFLVNRKIEEAVFQENLIIGLNSFLEGINQTIRYTAEQIRLYKDHENYTCIMINGDYRGRFHLKEDETEFDNRFLSQIFLLTYMGNKSLNNNLSIRLDNGEKFENLKSFQKFVSKMGRIEK